VKTLRDLASRLFKEEPPPSARLSFLIGVGQRQTQYWLAGRNPTPADVIETVESQIQAVEAFDLDGRIQRLINEAEQAGIKDPVLMHYLDNAVDALKDRGNNP